MLAFEPYRSLIDAFYPPFESLKEALHLEASALRIAELRALSLDPSFWQNAKKARQIQTELSHLERKHARFQALAQDLEELNLLYELGDDAEDLGLLAELESKTKAFEKALEDLRLETYFTGPNDAANAIVSLHAGAGGTEAQDWTQMLLRMYQRYCERQELGFEILEIADGDPAGIKGATFKVTAPNAYGLMQAEMGVHRLVRMSPFDNTGRRHTSFASVEVIPELDDSIEVNIRSEDLRVDTYRSSGAGGQHVNKTSSAVRLTHLPTGVVVACQNERSQSQNKETAMRMLKAKLYAIAEAAQLERIEDLKGESLDIAFGNQIRSYVFCPYTLVKDVRTNEQSSDVDAVMDGKIERFIVAYLAMNAKQGGNDA